MKILSWNMQWGRGMDDRVDLARMARDLRGIGDFDVICLQEVAVNFPGLPGNDARDQVAELAALLPGYTSIYAPATDLPDGHGGRKQFGNAIFSRLPVGRPRIGGLGSPAGMGGIKRLTSPLRKRGTEG